jgi:peptidoglycan/xylan/chitin deacetylase (PgdA/CDA1 family)
MRGIARIRRAAAGFRHRLFPGSLVLLYHRVADPSTDPFDLCVTPRAFAEHLEVIRSIARPISLGTLTRSLAAGGIPRKGVVVTFDDGYADNLLAAKPLLEAHDVPATFFITTGSIGSDCEYWWDQLERIVLRPGPGLATIGEGFLGDSTIGFEEYGEEESRSHRGWKYSDAGSPHSRHRLFRHAYSRLQAMSPGDRDQALIRLGDRAQVSPRARPDYRAMSGEELARLACCRILDIGAHTVRHPLLPALGGPVQRQEIRESKAWLEEAIGRPVGPFSYPHGGFTDQTISLVREAGFGSAFSTRAAVATARDGRYAIPRVVPEGKDGDSFARFLRGWLSGRP